MNFTPPHQHLCRLPVFNPEIDFVLGFGSLEVSQLIGLADGDAIALEDPGEGVAIEDEMPQIHSTPFSKCLAEKTPWS